MAAKLRRIPLALALVIALGAYLSAVFIVLTRPGSVLSDDKRTVIRFAHWQIETGPRKAFDAMIKRFEELNPQVRVEQVDVPGRFYKQWLRTQLIGGMAPDIVEFGHLFDADDIYPRFLEPISDYMEVPNPYNRGTPLEGVRWRDTFLDGLNTGDTYIDKGEIPWPEIFKTLIADGYDGLASVETHLFFDLHEYFEWLRPATIQALRNLNRVLAEVQGAL